MKIPTNELLVADKVLLKEKWWTVKAIDGRRVTVTNGVQTATTDKVSQWEVDWRQRKELTSPIGVPVGSESASLGRGDHASGVLVDLTNLDSTDHLITVLEYLTAVGLPANEQQSCGRTFGTVLMKLYRARHGKDAKPRKKLEYVAYLDVNGMEAQRPNDDAPKHLRVRMNGWYESNAFEASDLDLFEEVRAHRHPGLPSLKDVTVTALGALSEFFDVQEVMARADTSKPMEVVWLAEKQISECLASGVVCGHEICARRRSKQSRRTNIVDQTMDWS